MGDIVMTTPSPSTPVTSGLNALWRARNHSIRRFTVVRQDAVTTITKRAPGSVSLFQQDDGGMYGHDEDGKCEREEIYFFGIIDILQQWSMRKQLERFGKGFVDAKDGISAVPPHQYAQRFEAFLDSAIR